MAEAGDTDLSSLARRLNLTIPLEPPGSTAGAILLMAVAPNPFGYAGSATGGAFLFAGRPGDHQ